MEKFADLSNVSVDGGVEIFKLACLVGKAHVVGINEFFVPASLYLFIGLICV